MVTIAALIIGGLALAIGLLGIAATMRSSQISQVEEQRPDVWNPLTSTYEESQCG